MSNSDNIIRVAANAVKEADCLVITAGAGMGVDSGLPDFRGKSGFWDAYPPVAKLGLSFSEMANPLWFEKKPEMAWAFYGHRLNLYNETLPHKGFQILKDLCDHMTGGYFVFTSNVDGHFQKAGFSDDFIEECHGSIHHFQCSVPCSDYIWSADGEEITVDMERFEARQPLPLCRNCGRIARPNILMFGDWCWISDRSGSQSYRFVKWLKNIQMEKMKIVVIEIGAGNSVPTVRHKSESMVSKYRAKLIRINPIDTYVPYGQISIPMSAKEGLEKILECL